MEYVRSEGLNLNVSSQATSVGKSNQCQNQVCQKQNKKNIQVDVEAIMLQPSVAGKHAMRVNDKQTISWKLTVQVHRCPGISNKSGYNKQFS